MLKFSIISILITVVIIAVAWKYRTEIKLLIN